jgi:hypothetical protein
MRALRGQAAAFDVWTLEPERSCEQNDQVVSLVDGKTISAEGFPRAADAPEAAGISE